MSALLSPAQSLQQISQISRLMYQISLVIALIYPFFSCSVIPPEGAKVEGVGSKELRKALQLAKKELEVERAKNMSLERECVVYQSQLEVSAYRIRPGHC